MTQVQTKDRFQNPGKTKVVQGSILMPHNSGLRFILSVINLEGKVADHPLLPVFDKKWQKVRQEVRGLYTNKTGAYKLGTISETAVQSDTWIVHMLCQDGKLVTSPEALKSCLQAVVKLAKFEKASVHVSNLLTEAIPELTPLLMDEVMSKGVNVTFYVEP